MWESHAKAMQKQGGLDSLGCYSLSHRVVTAMVGGHVVHQGLSLVMVKGIDVVRLMKGLCPHKSIVC